MFTLPRHKRTYASKKSKTSILLPRSVFPDSSAGIFNAFSIDNIRKNKQDADSSSLRTPYKQSNNAFAGQSSRKKRDEPLEIPAANFSGLEVSAVDMSTNITPNVSLHVKRDSLDAFDRLLMDKSEKNDMDIIAINTSDLKPNERAKINMSSDGSSRTSESPLIDLDSNDENECSKKKVRKKRRYMKKSKPLFGNITNQTNSIYDHKLEISKGLLKRSHTHIDSLMQNSRIRKILSDSLNRSQQIKRKCSNERVSIVPFSSTPLKKHCNKLKATSILSPILGNAISIENVSNQDCGRIEFNEKNSTNLSSISRSELNENETDFRTASFSGPPLVGFTSNSLAPLNRSSTPDMFDSNLDLQIELINDDNNKSLSNKSLALKKEDSIVKTGSVGEAKDISTDKNDEIMKEPSFTSIPKDTDTGMEENEFVNEYFYHSLENTNIDEENKTQNERDISNKTYLSNSSIVNEVIKSDSFFVTRRRNQHSGERNDTNKRLDYSEYIPFISLCDIDSSLSDNSQKSEIIQIPSSASGTSNHSINTSPDRSLIGSPDHSLNTSLDHSSKISPDRPLNASPDRSLNASPDHPLNKSPDHSTIISPDWPLNASADRSLNASPDHSSHTSLHHSLNTSPDHSLNALLDHSSKMSPDWPLNTSPDRSLNASPDHPLNKSPDHSPKISPDWPLNRSLNASPDHSSNTSLDHLLNTSPDHSLNTSPDHSLNTSPDHSLNTSPDHSSKISPYQPLNLSPDRSLNASPDHSLNTSRDHSSKTSLDRPLNVLPDRSLQASPDLTAPPPSEIIEILSSTLSNHSMNCLYSSPDHSFKSPKKASSSYSLKTSLGNSSSTSLNESDEKDVTIRRRSSFCLRSRRVVLPAAVKKPIPQKKTKLKRTKKAHNIIHEDEVASFDSTVYPFMNDSNVIGMQSYVLQPGKRWERSLSILKRMSTLNASVMPSRSVRIVNDAVSPSQGRKCRESIANVLRMQKRKDSHLDYTMNQTVTSRFFKSPSRRQTMRIVLEQLDFERSNLFEENDFSTLISPPDGEAAGNDSLRPHMAWTRLGQSKVY